MNERKYMVLVQPSEFNKYEIEPIDKVIVSDMRGKILLDDNFNCNSYRFVRQLLLLECELITYNGTLLNNMIYCYWNFENPNILDLMDKFSYVYQEENEFSWDCWENPYKWQKLQRALRYYHVKNFIVDIYNPHETLKKTLLLYRKMKMKGDIS